MPSLPAPTTALADLWRAADQPEDALPSIELTGAEPVLPSSFAIGTAAQASIAAATLAAGELWRLRSGRRQRVTIDMRDAALEFRSERYLQIDGQRLPESWDKIAGLYRCRDGWVRLRTNFPHHRNGVLELLGCAYDRTAVQQALERWDAEPFETAAAEAGLVVTATRSLAAWDAHEQGRAVAALPVLSIEQIGEAPPRPLPRRDRPLAGVRVLDLTRVIAGPVCGRTLAAHGADVLLVTAAHLPQIDALVIDCGRGKLSTFVDLRGPGGRATLGHLLRDADVSLSAYGPQGPWAGRRGFDSLVQNANGMNVAEAGAAGAAQPTPLPCQALDHASGYLMAFGALTALARQATVGGSWHVRVSLAQTGQWIRRLGRVPHGLACPDPKHDDARDRLDECASGFGRLTVVRHAAVMSETPPRWDRPSVPLGAHPAVWPS